MSTIPWKRFWPLTLIWNGGVVSGALIVYAFWKDWAPLIGVMPVVMGVGGWYLMKFAARRADR